jgi:hypothetical protein
VRKATASLATALWCVFVAFSTQAKADTIFPVSGNFGDNATLSGTVTIDTTATMNWVTAIDVTTSAPIADTFASYVTSFYAPGDGEVLIEGFDSTFTNEIILAVPVTTLTGFTGSLLAGTVSTPFNPTIADSEVAPAGGEGTPTAILATGQLGVPAIMTPEPSSFVLLGSAIAAFAGFRFCRRPRRSTW